MKTVYVLLAQGIVKIRCESVMVQAEWLVCLADSRIVAQFRTPSIFGWHWQDSLVVEEPANPPVRDLPGQQGVRGLGGAGAAA